MSVSVHHLVVDGIAAAALLVGMIVLLEVGRLLGLRRMAADPDAAKLGTTAVDGAIFGLLGLLIAFTFSGAMTRFDHRRQLIVDEANAVDVAYRRLDLLPDEAAARLRDTFRRYLDSRLAMYRKFNDEPAAMEELDRSKKIQGEIWDQVVAASRAQGNQATTMLLLPAVNELIDITTTRTMERLMHPPLIIFFMLGGLALVSALLAGYGMSGSKLRSWIHMLAFAVMVAMTVYITIDIEYPRRGLIRIDAYDQVLVDLRENMK